MKRSLFFIGLYFLLISGTVFSQIWSPPKRLTWNAGESWSPSLAADSGNGIHVVWYDLTPGNEEIFFKCSSNSGTSWSELKRLTWNGGASYDPAIVADSGNGIHVVWWDTTPGSIETFYKRSSDSGATWSLVTRLTWNYGGGSPAITADSMTGVHIVWQNSGSIFYKRSTDSGVTWSGRTRLTWNSGFSRFPKVASDSSSGIYVVWEDDTPGNKEIFYKRSTDGGLNWSGLSRLTWNSGLSTFPDIAVESVNKIHVVWRDDFSGNNEIYYRSSTDGGITWSELTRLTWNAGLSLGPSITADSGGNVHVVWYDNTPGNFEIFYKFSTNTGNTWSGPSRLTWNGGGSWSPRIVKDSGSTVHLVWFDEAPGNYEIFYKNLK